jgi:hypothetical protein
VFVVSHFLFFPAFYQNIFSNFIIGIKTFGYVYSAVPELHTLDELRFSGDVQDLTVSGVTASLTSILH